MKTGSRAAHEPRIVSRLVVDRFDGWKRASNGNCYSVPRQRIFEVSSAFDVFFYISEIFLPPSFPVYPIFRGIVSSAGHPWNSFRFVSFPSLMIYSPIRIFSGSPIFSIRKLEEKRERERESGGQKERRVNSDRRRGNVRNNGVYT